MRQPIDIGTTEVFDLDTRAVVGYGFVDTGQTSTGQYIQRWVLFDTYQGPPKHAICFRRPQAADRVYTSIEAWTRAVQEYLWQPGCTYVKVTCISNSSIMLTPPSCVPQSAKLDQQIWEHSKLFFNDRHIGYCYLREGAGCSQEHWIFFGGYVSPPEGTLSIGALAATEGYPTLDEFLAAMGQSWDAGNVHTICDCTQYSVLPSAL